MFVQVPKRKTLLSRRLCIGLVISSVITRNRLRWRERQPRMSPSPWQQRGQCGTGTYNFCLCPCFATSLSVANSVIMSKVISLNSLKTQRQFLSYLFLELDPFSVLCQWWSDFIDCALWFLKSIEFIICMLRGAGEGCL